jgi:hypothetical protein
MHRGRLPPVACRHVRVDGLQRPSGRNAYPPAGSPHQPSCRRANHTTGSRTEIRLCARAHNVDSARTAPVKRYALGPSGRPTDDRPPLLALHHNQWSLGVDHLNNIDNVPNHERYLTGHGCTDKATNRLCAAAHKRFYVLRPVMRCQPLGGRFSPAQAEITGRSTAHNRRRRRVAARWPGGWYAKPAATVQPSGRSDDLPRNRADYRVTLGKAASRGRLDRGSPPSLCQTSTPASAARRRSFMCCLS